MKDLRKLMSVLGSLVFLTAGLLSLWAANRPTVRAQSGSATLFEGARLIVGDGSAPIENSAFIVENSRFTLVGRKGQIQAPKGAVRVDLTGKTVMPAMIDTHMHAGGSCDRTREQYIEQLNWNAYAGIAAAASMGRDCGDVVFGVRAEQPPNGAQMLTSGRGMIGPLGLVHAATDAKSVTAVTAAGAVGRLEENAGEIATQLATEEEARNEVRRVARQRVDFIKLWVDDRLGTEVATSPVIYRAIIDEAHKHNIRVFAHFWALDIAKDLVRSGIDSLAHVTRDKDVDDELIQLLKERPNVFMGTTLQGTYVRALTEAPAWIEDPLLVEMSSPEDIKSMSHVFYDTTPFFHEGWPVDIPTKTFAKQIYGRITRNIRKLYAAGIPYAIGTEDKAGRRGFGIHVEMELLVKDVGLTPSQALTMATQGGAKALHLNDLGTVASGKSAAFIVLDANPLDNITNTRRISKVYLRGHEIDRAAMRNSRGIN